MPITIPERHYATKQDITLTYITYGEMIMAPAQEQIMLMIPPTRQIRVRVALGLRDRCTNGIMYQNYGLEVILPSLSLQNRLKEWNLHY